MNLTQWERFKYYANFIKEYYVRSERFDGIASASIHDWTRGKPLLPNLRTLEWVSESAELSGGLLLFLVPGLHRLRASFSRPPWDLSSGEERIDRINSLATGSLLLFMKTRTPGLRELHISAWWPESVVSVPSFQELRCLTLEDIMEAELIGVACHSLPRLERLTISQWSSGAENPPSPNLALGSLTYLKIEASLEIVDAMLNAVQTRQLSDLVLILASRDPDANYHQICKSIVSRFSSTLINLHITPVFNPVAKGIRCRLNFDTVFSPLYAIRNLETAYFPLSTVTSMEIVVTGNDIATMATSWPALEVLHLPSNRLPFNRDNLLNAPLPRPPITALALFAQCCPRLTELDMLFPDPAPLAGMAIDAFPRSSSRLKSLSLRAPGCSNEERAGAFRYLMLMFPMADLGQCYH